MFKMNLSIDCPICRFENIDKAFSSFNIHGREIINQSEKFNVFRCNNCGTFFLNIKIDKHYYNKYYKTDYYKSNFNGLINLFLTSLGNFSSHRKQQYILSKFYKNKRVKLLDIGCGTGEFLKSLNKIRFDKFGVEINPIGAELCRKNGLKIFNEDILIKDFGNEKFDVITLWHVLEHIEKPMELLNKVHQILENNGILVLATPNTDSLGFKFGRKYWFHLDSPRHLILYNQKNVNWLLEESGFKIIEVKNEFYDYPLDLFWSIRKSKVKFLIYPLYPFFKIFTKEHLTFICEKIGN